MPISSPSIWSELADWANNDVWIIINAGTPTNGGAGTGNGLTGPGAVCIDITNKVWYVNVNTKASPTWAAMGGNLFSTILSNSSIKSNSPTAGVGYATGAGGTVTQITSKSTGVTLNTVTGQITMNNANLAATTSVAFTLTNSAIAATDVIIVNFKSGNTANSYTVMVDAIAAGSCSISLRNYTAGALAEAVVLQFAVIKGVNA